MEAGSFQQEDWARMEEINVNEAQIVEYLENEINEDLLLDTIKKQPNFLARNHKTGRKTHEPYEPEVMEIGPKSGKTRRNKPYVMNKIFKCDKCIKSFSSAGTLVRHKRTKHEKNGPKMCQQRSKRFPCRTCGKRFEALLLLDMHRSEHTYPNPLQCNFCGAQYSNKREMLRHLGLHHIELRPQCPKCKRFYKNNSVLYRHLLNCQVGMPLREDYYVCRACGKSFSSASHLKRHLKTHTGGDYHCDFCPKTFVQKHQIERHILWKHFGMKSYNCADCGKGYTTKNNLEIHMRVHNDTRPFECGCGKGFLSLRKIQKHGIKCRTGLKIWKCPLCYALFQDRLAQKQHIESHKAASQVKVVCNLCSKTFQYRIMLQNHMRQVHYAKKQCNTCGDEFDSDTEFRTHMDGHSDKFYAAEFKCLDCHFWFENEIMLRRHLIVKHNSIFTKFGLNSK